MYWYIQVLWLTLVVQSEPVAHHPYRAVEGPRQHAPADGQVLFPAAARNERRKKCPSREHPVQVRGALADVVVLLPRLVRCLCCMILYVLAVLTNKQCIMICFGYVIQQQCITTRMIMYNPPDTLWPYHLIPQLEQLLQARVVLMVGAVQA